MLFSLALFFNFFIGGVTGVFLSDAPSDVTTHGSFFVVGPLPLHHHGRVGVRLLRRLLLLVPKLTGFLARSSSGCSSYPSTPPSSPCSSSGFLDQPRRVSAYAAQLQGLNDWITISAYFIGLSMVVFIANLVYSWVFERQHLRGEPMGSRSHWSGCSPVPFPGKTSSASPESWPDPTGMGLKEAPAVAVLGPAAPAVVGK